MRKTGILLVMTLAILLSGAVRAGDLTSSVDVTFYGYIKVDTIYQNAKGYGLDYLVFVPPANLYSGDNAIKNGDAPAFGITARQTRFGFKVKGPTFGDNIQVLGKIEGDFYGATYNAATDSWENKGDFALRIAEIELRAKNWGLLAGNEWMIMSPLAPHVSNYTAQAELGNLGYRMQQLRFTSYMLDNKLQVQLAASNKIGDKADYIFLDIDSGRNAAVPDGQLGIVWDSKANGKPLKLGFTGHYGKEIPKNASYNSIPSYSMNVHYMLPLTTWLSLNGEYYQGANLDGYYCGAQGRGWYRDSDKDREPLQDTGGWAEVELGPLSEKIFLYTGYSWDDADDAQLEDAVSFNPGAPPFNITRNQAYFASIHYWPVPKSTDISLEWMQVDSSYDLTDDMEDGIVDRYTLSFWLFF